jgi:hypothetical protein
MATNLAIAVILSDLRHSERGEESWWNTGAGQILRCAQNDRMLRSE